MSDKIIFLDIDGVLNTIRSQIAFGDKGGLSSAWDITGCQMLRTFCQVYDYKIVISSTWRKHTSVSLYLSMYGLVSHVYGNIPSLFQSGSDDWRTPCLDTDRGGEVKSWLSKHPDVKHYIIMDDDDDFLDEQKQFLVQTNSEDGISFRNFEYMVKLAEQAGCSKTLDVYQH